MFKNCVSSSVPPQFEIAKCVSRLLGIMSNTRKEIDIGFNSIDQQSYIKYKFPWINSFHHTKYHVASHFSVEGKYIHVPEKKGKKIGEKD